MIICLKYTFKNASMQVIEIKNVISLLDIYTSSILCPNVIISSTHPPARTHTHPRARTHTHTIMAFAQLLCMDEVNVDLIPFPWCQSLRTVKQSHRSVFRLLLFQKCAKVNPFKDLTVQSVPWNTAGSSETVWEVEAELNVPWETDETWCCCACRRLLRVPLGMQVTALPMQSATSTLAMVLPVMLRKTLDGCRARL